MLESLVVDTGAYAAGAIIFSVFVKEYVFGKGALLCNQQNKRKKTTPSLPEAMKPEWICTKVCDARAQSGLRVHAQSYEARRICTKVCDARAQSGPRVNAQSHRAR